MKNFILFLAFILSTNSFAQNGSGNVSNIVSVGGVNISRGSATTATQSSSPPSVTIPESSLVTAGYKTLAASIAASQTSQQWTGFYDTTANSGSIYQVPAGKNFWITQICIYWYGSAGDAFMNVGTSGASFTSGTTTEPATTPLYFTGAKTLSLFWFDRGDNKDVGCYGMSSKFNSGLFPFFVSTTSAVAAGAPAVTIYGKEQ